MFSGEASAKVEITKAADKTTYLSSTKLDVQLVHLVSAKFVPEDLNQDMLAEFNALPTTWTTDPMAFHTCVVLRHSFESVDLVMQVSKFQ